MLHCIKKSKNVDSYATNIQEGKQQVQIPLK